MKKKKKAPAAQHLIDSLLDEAAPSPAPVRKLTSVTSSVKSVQSFGDSPFLDSPSFGAMTPKPEPTDSDLNISGTASPTTSENAYLGAKKSLVDDGQSPTILLSAEDEATSHLKIDSNSDALVPDPIAKAERAERTRLGLVSNSSEPTEPRKPEPVAPPQRLQHKPPFDGTKPVTQPKPERISAKSEPVNEPDSVFEAKPLPFEPPSNENTVKLDAKPFPSPLSRESKKQVDHYAATEIRSGAALKRPQSSSPSNSGGAPYGGPSMFSSAEAALKQSESLRIAQGKITELEVELERLRRENENLASAGETLRRRADELVAKTEAVESQAREAQRIHDEERKVLRSQLTAKDRETADLRSRVDEMETRLESNFKKIRVRERELEHRLEIVKMESATLVSTKDKMILELKRQIDQLTHEKDYGNQKTQELFNQYKDKQETIRRVVRALRIALTILEGDEDNANPLKKVE